MLLGEREQILAALERAAERGESVVLASVVAAYGSVYRRTGARMLVASSGEVTGTVSGGCLEGDLLHQVAAARANGTPTVITYDTRDRDDAIWGSGAGCRGVVEVLLEPLSPPSLAEALDFYRWVLAPETPAALVTLIRSSVPESRPGACLVVTADAVKEWRGGGTLHEERDRIIAEARAKLAARTSGRSVYELGGGTVEVEFEIIEPPVRLLVVGGGADAIPVTHFGRALGWRVDVVDHRDAYALPSRFPAADRVICSEPERLSEQLCFDDYSAVVVMTHSYPRDRIYLSLLLASAVGYIGMLGPASRTEDLLAELDVSGSRFLNAPERIYGPVGLDLGSESPESIALSIVAGVQAHLTGRSGGSLRERRAPIHAGEDGLGVAAQYASLGTR